MRPQALGYKIGQIRIREMRTKAERALGARFDVKKFHSQVVRDGALPLAVLEAKIERWIAKNLGSPRSTLEIAEVRKSGTGCGV